MDQKEQWNARYAGEEFLFGEEPNAFLKAQAALLRPGMNALAIADGEGRNGVWLAEQGLSSVKDLIGTVIDGEQDEAVIFMEAAP